MVANPIEIATALGVVIGLVMALTGAGGSIIAIPLLMFFLHLELLQAAPVGLIAVMLAASMAAIMGLLQGIVRYKAATVLAISGLLTAPIGVWIGHHVGNQWLQVLFAFVLAYVASRMWLQAQKQIRQPAMCVSDSQPCKINQSAGKLSWNKPCARAMLFSGSLTGLFSGLLGVGGGFVIVPALRRYTNFDMKAIVATSLAAVAMISLVSVLAYEYKDAVDWSVARPFALGAAIGLVAGKWLSTKLSGPRIQQGFALTAWLVAVGLIVKAI